MGKRRGNIQTKNSRMAISCNKDNTCCICMINLRLSIIVQDVGMLGGILRKWIFLRYYHLYCLLKSNFTISWFILPYPQYVLKEYLISKTG